jgi:hypothetical protein
MHIHILYYQDKTAVKYVMISHDMVQHVICVCLFLIVVSTYEWSECIYGSPITEYYTNGHIVIVL